MSKCFPSGDRLFWSPDVLDLNSLGLSLDAGMTVRCDSNMVANLIVVMAYRSGKERVSVCSGQASCSGLWP